MRPETKERTDTIIDSALRASFTFERGDSWRAETEEAGERRRQQAE